MSKEDVKAGLKRLGPKKGDNTGIARAYCDVWKTMEKAAKKAAKKLPNPKNRENREFSI